MLPKGEQKKILKLLNSKHFIERLDALHKLKDAGEHAVFAVSKLTNLIQKDPDDLVIINALDILAILSSTSPELVSIIETASTSERMGVRKKAEKLLNKIGPVEEISAPDMEEPPLTDEHFEKVEETITEIPTAQDAVPVLLGTSTEMSFDLEEFSVGEITELKSIETVGVDPVNGVLTQSIPAIPKAIPTPPPEPEPEEIMEEIEEPEEAVEEIIEEIVEEAPIEKVEEVDEDFKLIELKDAPIENSLKNLLMLTQNLSSIDKQDVDARNEIQALISGVLDELTDHLHILMGIDEEDWKMFVEYQFSDDETEYLKNIIFLIASKLPEEVSELENLTSLNFIGTLAHKLDLIDETVTIYNLVLQLDDTNLPAHNNLGLIYAKLKQTDEAIEQFEAVIKLEPSNASAHSKIADLYFHEKQDIDKAIEHYKKALECDPARVTAGINLAAAMSKNEKYDEATSILLKCLKTNREEPDLWLNYAILLVKQLKFYEAIEGYTKALEIAPEDWKFRQRAEEEKEKVEKLVESQVYSATKEEEMQYVVDKSSKVEIERAFVYAQNVLDDEVFRALFDYFKSKKPKYLIPEDIELEFGSIMNREDFPIDPLRAKEFAELIWEERFNKELDITKFHQELFDLEEYDKLIVFLESK
ncbi:MAG: tetratricopeptide repeat protein [Candidatus Heimdallarchaeota archaeon]|nr:tetratricopeptide repeat protein [Candidatus Heimdallarchaeota archaeon]MCK4769239.1 tetratricopeptide repeat protein [Candidatus Heimdallarchaeota archaeon]